jgi:hypothetical protein
MVGLEYAISSGHFETREAVIVTKSCRLGEPLVTPVQVARPCLPRRAPAMLISGSLER